MLKYSSITYPFCYKKVGVSGSAIVSIGRKNEVFAIVGEDRESIKSPVVSDSGQACGDWKRK